MSEPKPRFYKRAPVDRRDKFDLTFAPAESSDEGFEAMGDRIAAITQEEFGMTQSIDFASILYTGGIVAIVGRSRRKKIEDTLADGDVQIVDGTIIYDGRAPDSQNPLVLVDNSINSGRTFERTMEGLRAYNLHPEYFLKLVDYGGAREARTSAMLGKVGALSVYDVEELRDSAYLSWRHQAKIAIASLARR